MRDWAQRFRLVALGGVSAIALAGSPAQAQSAADIEALQRRIEALQEQLEALRQQVESAPPPAPAELPDPATAPKVAVSGNDKVKLAISGQVNRGVLITEDGDRSDVFFVDNDGSSTRLNLTGTAQVNDDFKAGTVFEVEFESNSTKDVSQRNERNVGKNSFGERKLEVFFDHKQLGKLSIGQGDTASNVTTEVDLSGTDVIIKSEADTFAGGILYRDDDGNLTDIDIDASIDNLDGLSRDDRVRYDSPSFGGFKLSGSAVADERYDVAARYSRQFGDTEVEAAASYATKSDDFDRFAGSASVLLGSGLNFTVAAGTEDEEDRDGDDAVFFYGKIGYKMSLFDFGGSAFAVDYYYGENINEVDDETNVIGIALVQKVDVIAADLYVGYRYHDYEPDGQDLDPINAILTGARIKF